MQKLFFTSCLCITILLTSCSGKHLTKKADEQVYQILKKAEKHVFGKSQDFNIDTKYSGIKSNDIQASDLLKESQSGGKLSLSIDQALNYAAANSREYQSEKESLYLSALALTGVINSFSPNISSIMGARANNQSNGDLRGNASLNQRLSQNLTTGGSYSLALANDLLRYFTGDPRESASSVISINILQPLLRGAGRKIAAERYTQANRDVIYAVRDFQNFQNTFSIGIVIQYLRLLQQKESVDNQYKNYIARQKDTEYLIARSVDRASPQEVSDSEQGELQAKNNWINAKTSYQTSLDNFKLTIGAPTSVKLILNDKEFEKIVESGLQPLKLNEKQAFNLALKYRLPLMNSIDRFDDAKRQVVIAAEQLKAEIGFVASASLASKDGRINNINFNDLSSQVGVELNLPINRINERNGYRRSLIQFQSRIRSMSNTYNSLNILVFRRIREIQQFRKSYEIQLNAVKLAKRRVEGIRLRFQAGNIIFRRLSEAQDSLVSAQNAVTDALIDYQNARLQLYSEIGILDSNKSNFWLNPNPTRLNF